MAYVNNPSAAAAGAAYMASAAAAGAGASAHGQPHQQAPSPAASSSLALLNMSNLINQKDSRWLQLEVCREFQRNKCSRSDTECKFAHPTSNVEVQNGRVTACYDSIKGRCNREKPPCKYFHPPQHLKDQLLINGRNHLALKNALMQQMGYMGQPFLANQFPSINSGYVAYPHATPGYIPSPLQSPYMTNPLASLNPAMMSLFQSPDQQSVAAAMVSNAVTESSCSMGTMRQVQMQALLPAIMSQQSQNAFSQHHHQQQQQQQQQQHQQQQHMQQHHNKAKSDRVEVCREFQRGNCSRADSDCRFAHPSENVTVGEDGTVTVCMDHEKGRCSREPCRYLHRPGGEQRPGSSTASITEVEASGRAPSPASTALALLPTV